MTKMTRVTMNPTQVEVYNRLQVEDPILAQDYVSKLARSMRETQDAIASSVLQQRFGFNPNKREAYMMPLSQLVTIWQAKHGDNWIVRDGQAEAEMFFEDAYWRLKANGLFEEVQDDWYRLKEGV